MKKIFILLLLAYSPFIQSQTFELVPLGVYGGGDESNLSSYLVGAYNSNNYLALDAGTIRAGIQKARDLETFNTTNEIVLRDYIKGYFISHGHLDHLSGLIINSPEDSPKPIYALPFVIDIFKNNYFTNNSWSNFANEGESPIIGKYTYQYLQLQQSFTIENTSMTAEVFELSHVNPQLSSALVVSIENASIAYLGDTGADRIERSNKLALLWKNLAPKIKKNELKALLIEVSFTDNQPEDKLFGHLTPRLLVEELKKLEAHNGKGSLKGLNVMITHLKPSGNQVEEIKTTLEATNELGVNYIFPTQGKRYLF